MVIYETLWANALAAFQRGEPELDPHLPDKRQDLRRGISLALRLNPDVQSRIQAWLAEIAPLCPGQYFYPPAEMHITLLSFISASTEWRREMPWFAVGRALLPDILRSQPSWEIQFRGITASPAGILIQGFPADDTMNQLRDQLRAAFTRAGLGQHLDRRYKISSAHITVLRFCHRQIDWAQLLPKLQASREIDFGRLRVDRLQLLWGDWYATTGIVRKLQEFPLQPVATIQPKT